MSKIRGYSKRDIPVLDYLTMMSVFSGIFATVLAVLPEKRRRGISQLGFKDLVLLGVATHKLSRIIARDRITSAVRAPFTRLEGPAGRGEVDEEPRGTGPQRALGELLTCPYCLGPWVGSGLTYLQLAAPEAGQLICKILSAVSISDFLHTIYSSLEDIPKPPHAEEKPPAEDGDREEVHKPKRSHSRKKHQEAH